MHRYTRTLAALVGAASLTLAACGGDDSSSSDDVISYEPRGVVGFA